MVSAPGGVTSRDAWIKGVSIEAIEVCGSGWGSRVLG